MSETIMSSKNTFEGGLVMDFSPSNTKANTLTSALNATLVTFNGNELNLQNDMGNGRVETARLPEGFIPVGTCEFGDIIYIVSYNPITNRSQIGCFPSPERNISSQELGDDISQELKYLDFQKIKYTITKDGLVYYNDVKEAGIWVSENQNNTLQVTSIINKDNKDKAIIVINNGDETIEKEYDITSIVSGELKNTQVKKVLLENKKLNPGDKYIIYTDKEESLVGNKNLLSDWGTGAHNIDPKLLKLHVVSIEDEGKITYLDTSTKWYDIQDNNASYTDYYINVLSNQQSNGILDIDSYRDLLESNWSIFNSKVSGKLAILAELETIDNFSCAYELQLQDTELSEDGNIEYKVYKLLLYPDYQTSNENIKPSYICASKSFFANIDGVSKESYEVKYNYYTWDNSEKKIIMNPSDNTIAIYETQKQNQNQNEAQNEKVALVPFESSLYKGWEITDESNNEIDTGIIFKIPYKSIVNGIKYNISSETFVYNLEIIPCMSYGRLDHLAQTITIDFNKIGTGEVELNTWKYHNSEDSSILTFGINYYPQPQHEIKAIIIDFYDHQGLCTEYRLLGKKSYIGNFTENFSLGTLYQDVSNNRFYNTQIDPYVSSTEENTKNSITLQQLITTAKPISHYTDAKYEEGKWTVGTTSDTNIIYPNFLYAAKIRVLTARADNEQYPDEKVFYRWFWTTPMYNDNYYRQQDFNDLEFQLGLTGEVLFASKNNFVWNEQVVGNLTYSDTKSNSYTANIATIGGDDSPNLKSAIHAGLVNNYNCFNLYNRTDIVDGIYKALRKDKTEWLTVSNKMVTIKQEIKNENQEVEEIEVTKSLSEFINNPDDYICDFNNPLENIEVKMIIGGGKITYDNNDYNWSVSESEISQPLFINKQDRESDAGESFNSTTDLTIYSTGLQDKADLKFANSDKPSESEGYKYYQKEFTLLDCIYPEISNTSTIDLVLKAQLFSKAYVENKSSQTLDVPVYKPIINSISDLLPLGFAVDTYDIVKSFEPVTYSRIYFSQGITLGSDGGYVMMSPIKFTSESDKYYPYSKVPVKDDNDAMQSMSATIDVSSIKSLWDKCAPSGLFFLTYPAWSVNFGRSGEDVLTTITSTEKWRKLYWKEYDYDSVQGKGLQNNSVITKGQFDVKGDTSNYRGIYDGTLSPFLSVKTKDIFQLYNSAYNSEYVDYNTVTQYANRVYMINNPVYKSTPFSSNFASQLYLLLRNAYHSNCRGESVTQEVDNIVANSKFKATLSRDIMVTMQSKEKTVNNIVFNNMDFNYYVYMIQNQLDMNLDYYNVDLLFTETAIQTQLVVEKNVEPIIAENESVKAYYITPNNTVISLNKELETDKFYILQNNVLQKYKDGNTYQFPIEQNFFEGPPLDITPYGESPALKEKNLQSIKSVLEQLPQNINFTINDVNPDNLEKATKDIEEKVDERLNNYNYIQLPHHTIDLTNSLEFYQEEFENQVTTIQVYHQFAAFYKKSKIIRPYHLLAPTFSSPLFGQDSMFYIAGYPIPSSQLVIETDTYNGKSCSKLLCRDSNGNHITYNSGIFKVTFWNASNLDSNYVWYDNTQYNITFPENFGITVEYNNEIVSYGYYTGSAIIPSFNYVYGPDGRTPLHNNKSVIILEQNPLEEVKYIAREADRYEFKTALGLNSWFGYDGNTLITTGIPVGQSFGIGGEVNSYIMCGKTNYYIDSHFRIDEPDQPIWENTRQI